MSVRFLAAVPATARPGAAGDPARSAELFTPAQQAMVTGAELETRVLVVAGPAGVVHDRAVVGHDEGAHDLEIPVDGGLMAAVAGRTGFSRGRTDRLSGDLAELVRWCAEVAPRGSLLPLEIPENAGMSTLEAVATGVRSAADATGRDVGVVAAGDLAVSGDGTRDQHPDGSQAARFDRQALDALHAGDAAAFGALGPQDAGSVGARGWAPLLVVSLLAEMVGLTLGEPRYQAHRGRGRVVIAP